VKRTEIFFPQKFKAIFSQTIEIKEARKSKIIAKKHEQRKNILFLDYQYFN